MSQIVRGVVFSTAFAENSGARRAIAPASILLRALKAMNVEGVELPVLFRYHAFCCFQQRPPSHPKGSCGAAGGPELWEWLGAAIQGRQLARVAMTATGCLGFCNAGPLMVVYPEGIWYQPRTKEDIDEIVQSHFVEGCPVARLIVILER